MGPLAWSCLQDNVSYHYPAEGLLIIRHDIILQKFHPNNPSISPQLANLNVLAKSKGHDLQIVGNIWIFPQELGSSFSFLFFFLNKIEMISLWSSLCHSLNKQILTSEMRLVLYTTRKGFAHIYFVVRDHTLGGYLQYLQCSWCHKPGSKVMVSQRWTQGSGHIGAWL